MTTTLSAGLTRPLEALILDDDYRWRYLVASHLESQLGAEPILAARGVEALEIMAMRPIDVVICDLLMPGMDGLQFLERAHQQFPRTKIIVLSADFNAFPIAPERLLMQGALAVIPKTQISSTLIPLLRLLQELPQTRIVRPHWDVETFSGWACVN